MFPRFFFFMTLLLLVACGGTDDANFAPAVENSPIVVASERVAPPPTQTVAPPPTQTTAPPATEPLAPPATETSKLLHASPTTEAPAPTVVIEATVPPVKPFDPRAAAISLGLEVVVSGLQAPVAVIDAADGSGRLFVVEKGGVIRVVENGEVLREPFLNVIDLVSGGSEQGLLGLAFEPRRSERFYINYTFKDGSTVVARYKVSDNPNIADGASGEILLTLPQPAANHNGGHLLFAPDGYLWIGTGDGGAANDRFENGQNTNSLLGAMLRIDVSGERGYTIPPDNPFVGGGGAPEIWAFGLRNPWRYSFDRLTGDLWIADVGQNEWEEVHRAASNLAGLNYGWPIMEGNHCFSEQTCSAEGLVIPITEYNHNFGCSITGGYVYRGQDFPALQGGYFFADYCSGTLWAIAADSNPLTEPTIVLESGLQISSFGEDERGELYLSAFDGKLYRLVSR